jgi:hypothetical protein
MTDNPEIEGGLTAEERTLAGRLEADRPVPAAGFRGLLGRHLANQDLGYGPRPARLRLVSFGYLTASVLLLAVGALQATGGL